MGLRLKSKRASGFSRRASRWSPWPRWSTGRLGHGRRATAQEPPYLIFSGQIRLDLACSRRRQQTEWSTGDGPRAASDRARVGAGDSSCRPPPPPGQAGLQAGLRRAAARPPRARGPARGAGGGGARRLPRLDQGVQRSRARTGGWVGVGWEGGGCGGGGGLLCHVRGRRRRRRRTATDGGWTAQGRRIV